MRIGFLFNHDHIHQVAHSLPIALSLARQGPERRIILAVTTDTLAAEVARLAGDALNLPNVRLCRLDLTSRVSRVATRLLQPFVPAAKLLIYRENIELFRTLDALVVSEKTSLVLKTMYRLDTLKLIHTRHGAGDRAIGFDRASGAFDLVLASGRKVARRLVAEGGVSLSKIRIVGYPKFDVEQRSPAPFTGEHDNRPIVLYNPHVAPHLSSWYHAGRAILNWFAAQSDYRLIFAPHVMLFRRRVAITIDPPRLSWPGKLPSHIRSAPNIHVDLGSSAATDMTYLDAADIYLGDASSQVYEFLRRPRPCLFFNAQGAEWRSNPSFAHWEAGRVLARVDDLGDALSRCRRDHALRYLKQQRRLFDDAYDLTNEPSALRAARAISHYLERPGTPETGPRHSRPRIDPSAGPALKSPKRDRRCLAATPSRSIVGYIEGSS